MLFGDGCVCGSGVVLRRWMIVRRVVGGVLYGCYVLGYCLFF